MKILGFIFIYINIVFANMLSVSKGNALVLINGEELFLSKDMNISLEAGSMVCLLEGNGEVTINQTHILSLDEKSCHQLEFTEDFILKYDLKDLNKNNISEKKEKLGSLKSKLTRVRAITSVSKSSKKEIFIEKSKKEVILIDKTYGPLPVTLTIKNEDGTIRKELVNNENTTSLFRIPTKFLNNGGTVEVTNVYGEVLLESNVVKEKEHQKVFYEEKDYTIIDVLYGTDRKINTAYKDFEDYYGGERGKLLLGMAKISIPKTHTYGGMERPGYFETENKKSHIIIQELKALENKEFLKILQLKLQHISEKDILVFIHGYNVNFSSAIRRTAQLTYDLNFKGLPLSYSWPSQGQLNQYMKDEVSVQYTVSHLVAFLKNIIDNKGDSNIHLLGHSMGTRALSNALKDISYMYPKPVFRNIILAAPDIDQEVFRVSLFPYMKKTTEQITLYVNSDDNALELSKKLHDGKRIGQGGDNIFLFKGVNTIDASGVDTSFLGHSYFAQKSLLVNDLRDIIYKSLQPAKRESLIQKNKNSIDYWKFKLP